MRAELQQDAVAALREGGQRREQRGARRTTPRAPAVAEARHAHVDDVEQRMDARTARAERMRVLDLIVRGRRRGKERR